MKLNFNPALCEGCDIFCMRNCRYVKNPEEFRKIAKGEFSEILIECTNCYACEEFCPFGNHPFYRIVELQEEFGVEKIPAEIKEALIKRYEPEGDFKAKKVKKAVHICLFPEFKDVSKLKIFEGYEPIRGRHLFCNLVYLHYGMISVIRERAMKVLTNMSSIGFDEVILFHDECYSFYNSFLEAHGMKADFRYKHLYEYFMELIEAGRTKKLNLKIAYQRPCSNRLNKTDKIFDQICKAIGVERVKRRYDRENSLCCGAAFILANNKKLARDFQERNISDIANTDADYVVFLCPMCYSTLSEKVKEVGMKPIMVHELFNMALL